MGEGKGVISGILRYATMVLFRRETAHLLHIVSLYSSNTPSQNLLP